MPNTSLSPCTVSKPPVALSDDEILTVVAYLQSLGGIPTVTMETEFEWQGQSVQAPEAASATAVAEGGNRDAETLFTSYLCNTCHTLDGAPGVGPSLAGIGTRMNRAQLYESLMDPDAEITEGFVAGLMTATLNATGFQSQVSAQELQTLVDYLAEL